MIIVYYNDCSSCKCIWGYICYIHLYTTSLGLEPSYDFSNNGIAGGKSSLRNLDTCGDNPHNM